MPEDSFFVAFEEKVASLNVQKFQQHLLQQQQQQQKHHQQQAATPTEKTAPLTKFIFSKYCCLSSKT